MPEFYFCLLSTKVWIIKALSHSDIQFILHCVCLTLFKNRSIKSTCIKKFEVRVGVSCGIYFKVIFVLNIFSLKRNISACLYHNVSEMKLIVLQNNIQYWNSKSNFFCFC